MGNVSWRSFSSPKSILTSQAYVLFARLHLGGRHLVVCHRPLHGSLALATARFPLPNYIRRRGPVHRASDRKRLPAHERRHPPLAQEPLLDADRVELHSVDDRAI